MSIVVEAFHKTYGDFVAVDDLNFTVEPNEILGFVGPNGAGKTTTLRTLAGILAPTTGRLLIHDHDIVENPIEAKRAVAYVPDDPKLFDQLTVWEHLRFTAEVYDLTDWQPRAEKLIEQFELTDKRDSLTSELSRGMRQKVAISIAYLHQPKALLLDEPLTGLDPRGIRTMTESIREKANEGTAVIISSHLLSLVEGMCTSILIINKGKQELHARLADLRQELRDSGTNETLEQLFFRLTETLPDGPVTSESPAQKSVPQLQDAPPAPPTTPLESGE
ncbi:MAG: ABC transporter ATP-binding protein [Gemmataceae bacterium]